MWFMRRGSCSGESSNIDGMASVPRHPLNTGEITRIVVRMATDLIVRPDGPHTKNDSDELLLTAIGVAYHPIGQLFAGGLPDTNDLDTELECLSGHLMIEVNGYRVSLDRDDGELDWPLVTLSSKHHPLFNLHFLWKLISGDLLYCSLISVSVGSVWSQGEIPLLPNSGP